MYDLGKAFADLVADARMIDVALQLRGSGYSGRFIVDFIRIVQDEQRRVSDQALDELAELFDEVEG